MSSSAADNYKLHVDIGLQKFILAEGGLYCLVGALNHLFKTSQLSQSAKLSSAAVCVSYFLLGYAGSSSLRDMAQFKTNYKHYLTCILVHTVSTHRSYTKFNEYTVYLV